MSFKAHLLIICCIIIAVVLAWQFMPKDTAVIAETAPSKPSYVISISHASWGLNCPPVAVSTGSVHEDVFMNKPEKNNKIHEDNVLGPVGLLCNGNLTCEVAPDPALLGGDPAPECATKTLEIEYRCFSYDRPWFVKTSSEPVTLSCDHAAK